MYKKTVKRPEEKSTDCESTRKKSRTSLISDRLESEEFLDNLTRHWQNSEPLKTEDLEIITRPYRLCRLSNFLLDETFLGKITQELKDVERRRNDMDLYQFEQTEDLANVGSSGIKHLYRNFQSDIMNLMVKITGVDLNGNISMSSATYSDTDYLLCHDDNMGDRRIAFVLYLTKDWTPEDGGALDMFDTDENGQPNNVVRSLLPEFNSLVFFEVVDNSYHQVAEITSQSKVRLSINGWFHGPLRNGDKKSRVERVWEYFEPLDSEVDLVASVAKIYLYESIVKSIQETIEKDSFIYLPGFLLPELYEALSLEIKAEGIEWERIGPADLQNYEIAREDSLPKILREFYDMFKSVHMFHLLKQYTELDLVPETNEMKPRMRIELQRWSRGCYTLINDKGASKSVEEASKEEKDNESCEKIDENVHDEKSDVECESIPVKLQKGKNPPEESHKGCKSKMENGSAKGKGKGKGKMPAPKIVSNNKNLREEIDSSDIEDYLSDSQSNSESDISELDGDEDSRPGTLDVLLQFHADNAPEDATVDYIDPSQKDGALIHIPPQDNHLCLVYRTADTCRCNKYVNHYCKDYFYTLVCSYYE